MRGSSSDIPSIAVIGAGIIGLACALEIADRGACVSLYEPNWPPRGASWAAAGMLAPAFEAAAPDGVHPKLFELCTMSAALWPHWASALQDRTGYRSGFQPGPTLAVARQLPEVQHLKSIQARMASHPDRPRDCFSDLRALAPQLKTDLRAALLLPSDGQIDNRLTLKALGVAIAQHERITLKRTAARLAMEGDRIGVPGHDAALICAGWASAKTDLFDPAVPRAVTNRLSILSEIQPYGGQMLSLAPTVGTPDITIRCGDLYIVPKADRIIVGATTEPGRVLDAADPHKIAKLRARAAALCPALGDGDILESWAGTRPGRADHAPILGETALASVFVAAGHFRNGILLAPLTAQFMADLILAQRSHDLLRAFSPQRIQPARV